MSSRLLSLLGRLSQAVSPEHRAQGDELFCDGAVTDIRLQPLLISGRAGGGRSSDPGCVELACRIEDEESVEVKARWAQESGSAGGGSGVTRVEVRCSCSDFAGAFDDEDAERDNEDGERLPCAHTWAMLLAADQHGLLEEITDAEPRLTLGAPLVESDGIAGPTAGLTTEPTAEPVGGTDALQRRRHFSGGLAGGAARGWRRLVDQVEALSRPPERGRPAAARGWSFQAVLDPESLRERRGRLHVDLFRQALRRDGRRSPLLPTTLADLDAASIQDEQERGGLALLRSLLSDQQKSERVYLDSRRGQDDVAYVLASLARAGCLRLPTSGPEDDAPRRILWQNGSSWTLSLRLDTASGDDARLRGFFQRARVGREGPEMEEREVGEATLVLRQGLLLWPPTKRRAARLAPLDVAPAEWAWIQTLREHDAEIRVPRDEIESFLDAYWSRTDAPELELPERLRPSSRQSAPTPTLTLRLLSDGAVGEGVPDSPTGSIEVNLGFDYGGRRIEPTDPVQSFVDPQRRVRVRRDTDLELEAARQLDGLPELPPRLGRSLLERGAVVLPVDVAQLPRWLAGLTLALEERVELALAERVGTTPASRQGWRIEYAGRPVEVARRIDARLDTRIDWFDLEASARFDSGTRSLPELLDAMQRHGGFVDLTPRPSRTGDRDEAPDARAPLGVLPAKWERALRGLLPAGSASAGGSTLRFQVSQLLLVDSLLADQLDAHVERDPRAREIVQRLDRFEGITPAEDPPGFAGSLRGYQRDAVGWFRFLREFRLGGCLADDMGLGKTVQVIAHLAAVHAGGDPVADEPASSPSLIVVPSSLVGNWLRELATFAPRLVVVDYTGPRRSERRAEIDTSDVAVTSYGILRRDIVELASLRWATVVLDEAQAIKNRTSRTTRAVSRLVAEQRLALTGTPVENHLGEAGSIFEFLNPGMLHSAGSSVLSPLVDPTSASDAEIHRAAQALRPLILRRTKEEVLADLPPKTEQTLHVELDRRERERYDELLRHYQGEIGRRVAAEGVARSRMHVLEALLRLRQAACHQGLIDPALAEEPSSKLQILLERIEECVEGGHKVLVFSQFTSLLSLVEQQLQARRIGHEVLTGRTRRRQERIDRFQSDADCAVFLISLKAGGVGLNLTEADYVFILDPWWNPASEAQAIDRAHRYGQQRPVFAYRLIARDTVEERIEELKARKRELADTLLAPASAKAGASLAALSAEDVERLLR